MPRLTRLTKKTNLNNLDGGKLYKINADYSKCEDLADRESVCAKTTSKIIDKLGPLEDFEEKLGHFGISLLIPLKALFDGIYVINEKGEIEWEPVMAIDQNMVILGFLGTVENGVRKGTYGYGYDSYGISWALTEEEL